MVGEFGSLILSITAPNTIARKHTKLMQLLSRQTTAPKLLPHRQPLQTFDLCSTGVNIRSSEPDLSLNPAASQLGAHG